MSMQGNVAVECYTEKLTSDEMLEGIKQILEEDNKAAKAGWY